MTEHLIWLHFIGAKYTVICNWVVLPYIEQRVSRATAAIYIACPIRPYTKSVVEPRVDWYKSIRLTALRYMDYWLMTDLSYDPAYLEMPWWSDVDNTSSP